MSLKLNVKLLAKLLQSAEACKDTKTVDFAGEVNEYLFRHYLTPMINGRTVTVGELDYSQFSLEDVSEFGNYLEKAGTACGNLVSFCDIYSSAAPVAQTGRAFC